MDGKTKADQKGSWSTCMAQWLVCRGKGGCLVGTCMERRYEGKDSYWVVLQAAASSRKSSSWWRRQLYDFHTRAAQVHTALSVSRRPPAPHPFLLYHPFSLKKKEQAVGFDLGNKFSSHN